MKAEGYLWKYVDENHYTKVRVRNNWDFGGGVWCTSN